MLPSAALLLADARLPSGGHAHSHGLEAAAARGEVTDLATLRAFVVGRLHTAGLTAAGLAAATAAACTHGPADWAALDAEASARVASPVLRSVSRRLGRQLLRVAAAVWPAPALAALEASVPAGPHQAVALGAAGFAAGLDAHGSAVCAGYLSVTEATSAAVRLLGLDPYGVARLVADLLGDVERIAAEAASAAEGPLDLLPCASAPLLDVTAQDHAAWEVRLFAS